MRLFSKFHDIYDPLFKYGMSDKSFVFDRVQTEDEYKVPRSSFHWTEMDLEGVHWHIFCELVGFCGKLYPLVKFESFSLTPSKTIYIYNIDELCKNFPVFAQYRNTKRTRKDRYEYKNHGRRIFLDITDWFDNLLKDKYYKVNSKFFLDLFRDKRCAYFYVQHNYRAKPTITFYPILKTIFFHRNFASVMEMFQKLEMYLLNDLAQLDAVKAKPISDKLHAETHGFDKWSFRKEPTKVTH